jgi:hypothetical protein
MKILPLLGARLIDKIKLASVALSNRLHFDLHTRSNSQLCSKHINFCLFVMK